MNNLNSINKPPDLFDVVNNETMRLNERQNHDIKINKECCNSNVQDNKDILQNFKACLKEDKKLFAHIHLSASAKETKLEGTQSIRTIQYLNTLLNHFKINFHFLPLFINLQKETSDLNKLINQHKPELLPEYASQIRDKISALAEGESFLMDGGYAGDPYGHAMFYQFKKTGSDSYSIFVYNAQMGVDSTQGGLTGALKNKVIPFSYYENVPARHILLPDANNEFLLNLLKFKTYPYWYPDEVKYTFSTHNVSSAFKPLDKYIKAPPEHLLYFITPQRSGNCSWHSLKAMLLCMISQTVKKVEPEQSSKTVNENAHNMYKYMMFISKYYSLRAYYELRNDPDLSAEERESCKIQLLDAVKNFCRHLEKNDLVIYVPENLLGEARSITYEILENLKPSKEQSDIKPDQKILSQLTDTVDLVSDDKERAESAGEVNQILDDIIADRPIVTTAENFKTVAIPTIISPTDSEQLESYLQQHYDTAVNLINLDSHDQALHHMESVIESIPIPSQKHSLWMKISPDIAVKCLNKMESFSNLYATIVKVNKWNFSARVQNAHMVMLVMSFELFKAFDKAGQNILNDFGLYGEAFQKVICEDHYQVIDDYTDVERRNEIIDYLNNQKVEHQLFDFDAFKFSIK